MAPGASSSRELALRIARVGNGDALRPFVHNQVQRDALALDGGDVLVVEGWRAPYARNKSSRTGPPM